MSSELIGAIGLIVVIALLMLKFWIGVVFLSVGFLGYGIVDNWESILYIVPMQAFSSLVRYEITALPMFILMAAVASHAGISGDAYSTARTWFGQVRGGLAISTIFGSALFAAISGSSIATNVAIGRAAMPELRKYGYDEGMAAASIAAGATMGVMIPPSIAFILYGILTETPIGPLFIAGLVPGLMDVVLYSTLIYLTCRFRPKMGPPGPRTSILEKIGSLKNIWSVLLLFLLVMGGIYGGIFTPTEAGALGAFGAMLITTLSRRLTFEKFKMSLRETAQTSGMIALVIIGVTILMRFLTLSGFAAYLGNLVAGLPVDPVVIIWAIVIFYIIAGATMDIVAKIFITVPIIFPIVMELGYDPIWFGVVIVMMFEMGTISPPVGLNVFILSGITGVPIARIFRSLIPFFIVDLIRVALIVHIPSIVMFLPNLMMR